jgi:hypothetical protein
MEVNIELRNQIFQIMTNQIKQIRNYIVKLVDNPLKLNKELQKQSWKPSVSNYKELLIIPKRKLMNWCMSFMD